MATDADVLNRNDLVYDVLPPRWIAGLPIGNGQVGGMVWVEDERKVIVTLDSVWAWDCRHVPVDEPPDNTYARFVELLSQGEGNRVAGLLAPGGPLPTKTYVGRLVIEFRERITGGARLRLSGARVDLTVRTPNGGETNVRIVALASHPVLVVEHDRAGDVSDIRIERVRSEILGGPGRHCEDRHHPSREGTQLPPSERGRMGEIEWIRQTVPENPGIALALLRGESRSYVTVQVDKTDPVGKATAAIAQTASDVDGLLDDHERWWADFWGRSSVQLPDAQIETLWYMGIYLLASCSRQGGVPVSLHGLWPPDGRMPPQFGFYIWDFYPQYWGIYGANHLELGDAYYDHFLSILPRLKDDTRRYFGSDGAFVPGYMALDGSWIRWGLPVLIWIGSSALVAQAFWWHYRYSRDERFLREKAYPFLKECMLLYEGLLEKDDDGVFHLWPTWSTELGGWDLESWARDDTLTIAHVRDLAVATVHAAETLGVDGDQQARWRDIRDNLAPYHHDETGLLLREGARYPFSHRYLPHLAPIYSCGDLNIEGSDDDRRIIDRSIRTMVREGYGEWMGCSYTWASLVAACAGRGQMAVWMVRQFAESFVMCNTFNLNGDWRRSGVSSWTDAFTYCQDGNMSAVACVNEMLLQGWGDRIRVFPACPGDWRDVRFDRLLAEGGVEVSSVRFEGRTLGVQLRSRQDTTVRVRDPFGEGTAYVNGRTVTTDEDGDFVCDLAADQPLLMAPQADVTWASLSSFDVARNPNQRNPYGLRYMPDELNMDSFDDLEEDRAKRTPA